MAKSPEERNHQEWLGYVQPVGLVVSTPALLAAQCHINKNIGAEHQKFLGILPTENGEVVAQLTSFRTFVTDVLGWRDEDLREFPTDAAPEEFASLEVVIPEYNETLRPTYVVPAFKPEEGESPWMMLVKESDPARSLDDAEDVDSRHWQASPHAKFERLLRETEVPIGILTNGTEIRLIYAPRGETSGYLTFSVEQMATVAGRPIFAAMHMLLCEERLFSLEKNQRLPAILAASRKYQNTVSTKLAKQVMAALFELLRGFQAADDQRKGELLKDVLAKKPQHVYHGLLTILMRTVFVLYAEDRGLLSTDSVYTNHYSISGLFERLRSDAGRFPDTMDQRYGAWAQLLTLFRLIYEGGRHGDFKIPARKGYLFDPDRYPFLEGRFDDGDIGIVSAEEIDSEIQVPRVSDGVIYRVLEDLLILDGERLSYRTLDVEQIGSVYEAIMGFELQVAQGRSIAIKPVKSHGAPATINLEAMLDAKPADRAKRLKELADQNLGTVSAKALKQAKTIEDVLAALDKKIARRVTPHVVPKGAMIFQPSDERRRSGSHYTPRSLTEPIVRTTLEPIFGAMTDPDAELPEVYEPSREDKQRFTKGELANRTRQSEKGIEIARLARKVGAPHPAQILDLKICDPAMGSGAFLVEACRQLGDALIKAWHAHDAVPVDIPPDEDEVLYARRLIAQRCLYGVDKNIMAVDLAKLSLWLVTLAKDHPFTFLDHSLRHGDSLVGLTREQIIGFHWEPKKQKQLGEDLIQRRLDRATQARATILNAREDVPYRDQAQRLALADEALDVVRLTADACVSAFFSGAKKKQREENCEALFEAVKAWYASGHEIARRAPIADAATSLKTSEHPVSPFHWEIEFPEVFARNNGGFDSFVGNPPFLGGTVISQVLGAHCLDYLKATFTESGNRMDLVAYFFRQCYAKLRSGGAFGLITTNTIRDGHTRAGGLAVIRREGGHIFNARRRHVWPGDVSVVVSVVHVIKHRVLFPSLLDGNGVPEITSYLFHCGGDATPWKLRANNGMTSEGVKPYGQGFIFDDKDEKATPLAVMREIIDSDSGSGSRIFPYIGGAEVNESPTHSYHRFIIDFGEMDEEEARAWPRIMQIVEQKVKPERAVKSKDVADWPWWQYWRTRRKFFEKIRNLDRVLVTSTKAYVHFSVAVQTPDRVFAESLVIFAIEEYAGFCVIQSRVHELWARFFSSSALGLSRYNASHCFQTFAMPDNWTELQRLEDAGRHYYEVRAATMVLLQQGLTETYHRFHDPHEKSPDILKLRELHDAMDRAVLRAYEWHDLAESARCEFLLDYEEEEDEEDAGKKKSRKKKPWRLRWPDEFRDEVLARLLELNQKRHEEEVLAGKAAEAAEKAKSKPRARKTKGKKAGDDPRQPGLF